MKIVPYYRGIRNAGFTMMELLLSMGILMILIGVLTTVFGQILDVQLESKAISSVDQNGRYLMARLTHDMQRAQSITTPATPGEQTSTLQIEVNSIDYTYSINGGRLVLTNNNGTEALSSEAVTVSGLTFTRIGNGDANDTIRVGFTVATQIQRVQGTEQKSFQTTLGLQ